MEPQQNNHNQNKVSNEGNLSFLIMPSQRLISYNNANSQVHLHLNVRCEDYVVNEKKNRLAVIVSKSVKSFDISNGLGQKSEPIFQAFFPKKVQGLTFDHNNKIIVSDKFGDIYQATPQNPIYYNSNLGIPTFLKHIFNQKNKKQYIILGDDYCKLKVYNYKNMHQITAIWYIPNSVPLDIIQIDSQRFVILVKHQDKQNLKHTYKLYQFRIENLDKGDFAGSLIYSDVEEKLNSSEYSPCTITYSQNTQRLYFLKLFEDRIQIVDFVSDKESGLFKQNSKHVQKLPESIKQGNSIDGLLVMQGIDKKQPVMLISYGKFYNIQNSQQSSDATKQVQFSNLQNSNGTVQFYKHNAEQFLLKWKLN